MHLIPSSLKTLIRSVLPPLCWACRNPLSFRAHNTPCYPFLCSSCFENLPWTEEEYSCRHCGMRTSDSNLKRCSCCIGYPAAYHRLWTVCWYETPLRPWIHQFKYQRKDELAMLLGFLMQYRYPTAFYLDQYDFVIPLPLHHSRIIQRGFNQSLLLAKHAAIPKALIEFDVLRRVQKTEAQARLSARARIENVSEAFEASRKVMGKRVLLLDDVMTTGATIRAASEALQAEDVAHLDVMIFARRE